MDIPRVTITSYQAQIWAIKVECRNGEMRPLLLKKELTTRGDLSVRNDRKSDLGAPFIYGMSIFTKKGRAIIVLSFLILINVKNSVHLFILTLRG